MKVTKLSILMQHLHLSATELANTLHVHPSLVSRWKNGQRYLDPTSEYFRQIVNYTIDRDELTDYKNIEVFLKRFDDTILKNRDDIENGLRNYLAVREPIVQSQGGNLISLPDTDNFDIYSSGQEKKKAILSFLDFSLTLPPGKDIYIMVAADVLDYLETVSFYEKWTDRLHSVIDYGHQVHFIHNYSITSIVTNFKNFYWLTAHDSFHGYFNPTLELTPYMGNFFIIKDTVALSDFYSDEDEKRIPIFSFTNKTLISQLQKLFLAIMERCQRLETNSSFEDSSGVYRYLKKRVYGEETLYIYDETPFNFPVSRKLFEAVLNDNGLSTDEVKSVIGRYTDLIYKPIHTKKYSFPKRCIFSFDSLSEVLQKKEYKLPNNLFSDKRLVIREKFYRAYLQEILEYIKLPKNKRNLEIASVDERDVSETSGLMTYVKENLFAFVYPYFSSPNESKSMLFSNNALMLDAWLYYDGLWQTMPNECKLESAIKAPLKDALELLS